jgi:hypothetical protein
MKLKNFKIILVFLHSRLGAEYILTFKFKTMETTQTETKKRIVVFNTSLKRLIAPLLLLTASILLIGVAAAFCYKLTNKIDLKTVLCAVISSVNAAMVLMITIGSIITCVNVTTED